METLTLNADTGRLLDLVVHALYTQPEVFLRELVSNASDALDRYRLESMLRPELMDDAAPLEITLTVDVAARTLTVADNGIGMSRDEVASHIGTIARSGTREFTEKLKSGPAGAAADLIGRFGVGFYSCFMVADEVTLATRRAGETAGTRLHSSGDVDYTLTEVEGAPRGTSVTLHLKPAEEGSGLEDYTNRWVLSRIVRRYADFVTYPIKYEGPPAEVPEPGAESSAPAAVSVVLNSMRPIWTRRDSDVSEKEYAEFFRHIAGESGDPLLRVSAHAEGSWECRALLFVPEVAPYDLYYHGYEYGLQLYSHRMLIAGRSHDLLPRYLRFVKGVVDASDMPLNVSRQSLQQEHHVTRIRQWLTKKVLDAFDKLRTSDAERYTRFWRQFGRAIKEGIGEDHANRERLLPLLLFESSADPSALTSLAGYISRMKPEQTEIFYLAGESRAVVEHSPHLEAIRANGYEVLYFTEPVDELVSQAVPTFDGRRLRSAAKGELQIASGEEREQAEKDHRAASERLADLLAFMNAHLQPRVRAVTVSRRLTASPACLTGADFDLSPHIQRLLSNSGPAPRRTLEINPRHPIIEGLWRRFNADRDDALVARGTELLFDTAVLAEGTDLPDRVRFVSHVTGLLEHALS